MSIKTIHGYNIEYTSSSVTLSKLVSEWGDHSKEKLEHELKKAHDGYEQQAIIGEEKNVILRYKGGEDYSIEKTIY